jgi:hypothetical protein
VLTIKGMAGSFETASLLVHFLLLAILTCVITVICEKSAALEMADGEMPAPEPGDTGLRAAVDQIRDYGITVRKTVFGTRCGFFGLVIAIIHFVAPPLTPTDRRSGRRGQKSPFLLLSDPFNGALKRPKQKGIS